MTREQFSTLLRSEMASRSWTVRDLAKSSGVTYEIVRRVVNGLGSTSVENATKILVAVGYDLRPVRALEAA